MRDVYANLLRNTRGMSPEHQREREGWFASLVLAEKEDFLFEFESLLKGLGCMGDVRNHSGGIDAPKDYDTWRLRCVRAALQRCVTLIEEFFSKKIPERMLDGPPSPQRSLAETRYFFVSHLEMVDGILRMGDIRHEQVQGVLNEVTETIAKNTFFNPLVALEFRVEFDRVPNTDVLEALRSTHREAAHQVLALAFLTMFRGLRYLAQIEISAPNDLKLAHVLLAVVRSDLRVLHRFLSKKVGATLADGFERELLLLPVEELALQAESLSAECDQLASLRALLESIGHTLQQEVRMVYQEIPAVCEDLAAMEAATHRIRALIHHSIFALYAELRPNNDRPRLRSNPEVRRISSDRLRREVWMFQRVIQAFVAKARVSEGKDTWSQSSSFHFVREFLHHFRRLGLQLTRLSGYEHVTPFMTALSVLRRDDVLNREHVLHAADECARFSEHLDSLFDELSERDELKDHPFDRRRAAIALRGYLANGVDKRRQTADLSEVVVQGDSTVPTS